MREIGTAPRLCFFSHFDADDRIDAYVVHYLQQLASAGFTTVFVTTSQPNEQEMGKLSGLYAEAVFRKNEGLDFGGWAECLARYPRIEAELLLLCNDSVYGPFWSLAEFIATLTASPADAYAAVVSLTPELHMMSWFLMLRPSAYRSAAFVDLMSDPVPSSLSKAEIIETYEMGLSRGLAEAGLTYRAAFDPRTMGPILSRYPVNPTFNLWRELLVRRLVPFVKIGILRDRPLSVSGLRDWYSVSARLDPELAAKALRNLQRRVNKRPAQRFALIRELMYLPTLPLAQLPVARRLLIADRELGGKRATDKVFAGLDLAYELFRKPYAWLYDRASRTRRQR